MEKSLNDLAYKQLPFAKAKALTSLGKLVAEAEVKNMSAVLDRPTQFTQRSVGVKAATKNSQEAIVYVKDIAAEYLMPYEFGGLNKLNSRALLKPVNVGLNQWGNVPRNVLAKLKTRSDVFFGPVKTKNGEIINGVWQRPYYRGGSANFRGKTQRGRSRLNGLVGGASNTTGHLKLLFRFADAHPVHQNLGWRALAQKVVAVNFRGELGKALAQAVATAK